MAAEIAEFRLVRECRICLKHGELFSEIAAAGQSTKPFAAHDAGYDPSRPFRMGLIRRTFPVGLTLRARQPADAVAFGPVRVLLGTFPAGTTRPDDAPALTLSLSDWFSPPA